MWYHNHSHRFVFVYCLDKCLETGLIRMKPVERFEPLVTRLLLGSIGLILAALGYAALTDGWANALLLNLLAINPAAPPTPDWRTNLTSFGQEIMLRGILLLAALGWLVAPSRWRRLILLHLQQPWKLATGAVLALAVLWTPVVTSGYSAIIGGKRYWWLFDDAMISMRYAHNLATGHGLVWNPGEYLEGYTNFLWVLFMALVHLLPIPLTTTSLVVSATNLLLSAGLIPLLLWLVRLLDGRTLAGGAALAGYVLSLNLMGWATAGAETVLLSLLLVLGTCLVLHDARREAPAITTYLVIGVMTLVRSDAVVLAAALCGLSLVLNPQRKRVILLSVLVCLFPAAHLLFRLGYYGDIVPNTAHLKVTNWSGRYAHGVAYILAFLSSYSFLLLFAVVGSLASRSRVRLALLGVVLCYGAYVAYAGGDGFLQFRFLVPILPLILVLSFTGIQVLLPPSWQATRLVLSVLCLVTMPLLVPGSTPPLYTHHVAVGNITIGLLLKQNVPPSTRVADFWAGLPFYYSDVRGIDLLGKNDPYIARLPAQYGDVPGHNKFDFDYSLGTLQPDYVLSTFTLPASETALQELANSAAPWRGELYFNPTFREHCLPYPVTVPTWRTIFACDWSPEVKRRDAWVVPPGLREAAPERREGEGEFRQWGERNDKLYTPLIRP